MSSRPAPWLCAHQRCSASPALHNCALVCRQWRSRPQSPHRCPLSAFRNFPKILVTTLLGTHLSVPPAAVSVISSPNSITARMRKAAEVHCIDLGDLLDLLVGHGVVSRDVLVTLDMHIHIYPDQNTRRSLGALTGCPRLRTLAIIYGEPESRPIRSWCHRTLTDALPVLLADQFSSTPAPHHALETLKLETTYWAVDLDHALRPGSLPSVLDGAGAGDPLTNAEDDSGLLEVPGEVSKRVFVPFATRGTDADVDAEFMFGEPPRNGAVDEGGEVVGGW
ncbi:uncharacterized protein BXZ73DRAFT_81065 [Epithele typhae]|uniref:uncharacterized protein n=1 Tax=Epithele typhae TaxID=378194 RepID=UPI00200824E6|nr:uncharacterized protein BXZ73DRAFT_81065 [Epithele typhae]KAH9916618.1 hypothetical protein BXZ73DRAFT_81065 [Epithele typhae]